MNKLIRAGVFQTAIKYDVNMIFTFVTAYDSQEDIEYLNGLRTMFEATGGDFYFVEYLQICKQDWKEMLHHID